jgi:hypothetical protein
MGQLIYEMAGGLRFGRNLKAGNPRRQLGEGVARD